MARRATRSPSPVANPTAVAKQAAVAQPAAAPEQAAGEWLSEVFCRDEAEIRALPDFDRPRVLKIVSRSLPHKTDAGAVRLGLQDRRELIEAFRDCSASAVRYLAGRAEAGLAAVGGDTIEGALITEMLPAPLVELLVGARRDPAFGPILTIGLAELELNPVFAYEGSVCAVDAAGRRVDD